MSAPAKPDGVPAPSQPSASASAPASAPSTTRPQAGRIASPSKPGPGPRPVENDREAALLALLKMEADVRACASESDLRIMIANETRKLTRARQIFVLRRSATGTQQVEAISSLAGVDRNTPLVQWIEDVLGKLALDPGLHAIREFNLAAFTDPGDETARTYPLRDALWVPFRDRDGTTFAGMLLTREIPWLEKDRIVAQRLAGAYAHAWHALVTRPRLASRWKLKRTTVLAALGLFFSLGLIPVPLTTLAPFEVAPRNPYIVAAPIDGVIDVIPIEPNASVAIDTVLVRFTDTTLRNRFEIAEREVLVADAKLKKSTQLAFGDPRGKHELGIARADLMLKTAERDYARDLLQKTVLRAPVEGLAVFTDKKELIGKPVVVGERIMEIANPGQVELRIDVPVADAVVLANGARVKAFLDAAPLAPIEARIVRADYQAKVRDGNTMSYRVVAEIDDASTRVPRLGLRGTAQLYGKTVQLGFYLFRRPISALRQWTGL